MTKLDFVIASSQARHVSPLPGPPQTREMLSCGRRPSASLTRTRTRPEGGRVLVQREVGPRLMVIGEIAGQDAAEVSLAEDEHVIQALAPDRADEPLNEWVLPRALRRREHLLDPHALQAMPKWLPVDAVAVMQEKGGRRLVR